MDKQEEVNQDWFWSKEWQKGEKQADKEVAEGKLFGPFGNVEDLLESLKS
jgi:hypothetical protein